MAQRDRPVEYVDLANGVKTLSIRLYAPDGDTFIMPHGGDPMAYTNQKRGFKIEPDDIWRAANKEFEAAKAASLKLSNFQRDIKHRAKALETKAALIESTRAMEAMEAAMAAAESAIDKPDADTGKTQDIIKEIIAPKAKPKQKTKVTV
jgi:hypothetical protein